jgi:hypothetical protein
VNTPAGRPIALLTALILIGLALGVSADRAFVTNRGGSTVSIFDTTTNTEAVGSPVTVGSGPIDIAADRSANFAPFKLFVANSGSNTVSVMGNNPPGVMATITGSGSSFFGTLVTPSGVTLVDDGTLGPAIVVVDQKGTTYADQGTMKPGTSTARLIDPVSNTIFGAFQEPSDTSRYNDVVYTSDPSTGNRRLWIADSGDQGVTVIKLDQVGLVSYPVTIRYQNAGEFADFITDMAATPTRLLAPRRLATNGTTRVVVADAGSKIVTILDGNYVSTNTLGEPGAVLAHVDLSTWAGPGPLPAVAFTCVDVEVVGNFAYVTTSNSGFFNANCFQIDLTTLAISASQSVSIGTVGGMGATSDGGTLYLGEGTAGTGAIFQLSINPPTSFTTAAVAVGPFTGGLFPFAFASSSTAPGGGPGGPPGPGPIWVNPSTSGSTSTACGLMGAEALLLFLLPALRRRKKA